MLKAGRAMVLAGLLGALASCEAPTKPLPAVASVVIGPALPMVDALGTVQLTTVVRDADGNVLEGRPVQWSVLDADLATVSASGLVTAKANVTAIDRTTTVVATVGGVSGQATLAVRPSVVADIDIAPYLDVLNDGQSATLVATTYDASGNRLLGRIVNWTSRDLATASVTADGVLTPVAFLGSSNRSVRIVASVGAVADSITVSVAPSPIVGLQIFPRQAYMQPNYTKTLRVEGRTSSGAAARGLSATFTSSNPSVATITSDGIVTSQAEAGTTQIVATAGAVADTITLTVDTCGAGPAGGFPLEVRFYGANPPSPSVEAAFNCAASRMRAIIRAPISATSVSPTQSEMLSCTGEPTVVSDVTTGLIIYAKVDSIDGPGKVLGSAGPCWVRETSWLPALGVMRFDSADLANLEADGRLLAVIMHEMLHVIGIGTIWRVSELNLWTGDVPNPGFLGQRAKAACVDDHGGATVCTTHVPIEDCVGITGCGSGTKLGHWRELIFRRELMTGYVSAPGQQNPLSKMTLQALADLGYVTDPDQGNDYVIPSPSLMELQAEPGRGPEIVMPAPRLPTHTIDSFGRLRPLPR